MSVARFVFFITIILAAYGGANLYIARRLYQWLGAMSLNIDPRIYAVVFILVAISIFLGYLLPRGIGGVFMWVGAYWLGIFVYLLIFTFIADAAVLLGGLARLFPRPAPQSVLFFKGLAVALLTVGVVCYGLFNATQIRTVAYEVQLGGAALDGMRIVMIGDSHMGGINGFERNLEDIVQKINSLEPDIVCLVGDIFSDDFSSIRDPSRVVALLGQIDSTFGVFACLGNHDGGRTLDQKLDLLERGGITLLNDEYAIIDGRLALVGRLDPSPVGGFGGLERREFPDIIASLDADLPIVVMEHSPSHVGEYGGEVDLILAGHTHGGHIFPGGLITRAIFIVDYGHLKMDGEGPHVIVTSGVSTWGPPLRVGTHNEIVSIVLRT